MMKSLIKFMGVGLLGLSLNAIALDLRSDHPDTYTVKKGDTLWDISSTFLHDPWKWPELWNANAHIKNPHLIYPGDVIALTYVDGKPRLTVNRKGTMKFRRGDTIRLTPKARVTQLETAIPAIPLELVQPFLVDNRVMSKGELNSAPYVLAGDEGHILMGNGDYAYARGDFSNPQRVYGVYRSGKRYIDPVTREVLGDGAQDIGSMRLESVEEDVARLRVVQANADARVGDRLLPTEERKVSSTFYPRAPQTEVDGQIIHVFSGVRNVSQWNVVVVNRGEREQIREGDVLAIFTKGEVVKDRQTNELIKLPDQRRGVLMIFRTFEKVSYGLVLRSSGPLKVNDRVGNP